MSKNTKKSGIPIISQILSLLDKDKISRTARENQSDRYYKKFKTFDHLVTMIYVVLGACNSLREITGVMLACGGKINHLGIKYFPEERWQIIASFPVKKNEDNFWEGINFTYYGLLIACAQAVALSIFIVLMGSINVSLFNVILFVAIVICLCVPASKILARIIEKKMHTFTVVNGLFKLSHFRS